MESDITALLVDLREDEVLAAASAARDAGTPAPEVIAALQDGMRIIGDKYEAGDYYLSELIMSAEIFKRALEVLGVDRTEVNAEAKATVVLCSVQGDIHDIGKDIVGAVLSANGFKVVDLGVDVSAERVVQAVRDNDARIVGLSCLLTTSFDAMRATISALDAAGLRETVSVFVGGGPVTADLAAQIGADGAGASAQEAVMLADGVIARGLS